MMNARKIQVPRMAEHPNDPQLQEEARDKILSSADTSVNCLRNDYGELPENL